MPFTGKSGKFNAAIRTVEIGTGDKAVKLGGENVLPFYTFDAPIENAPKIGVLITGSSFTAAAFCVDNDFTTSTGSVLVMISSPPAGCTSNSNPICVKSSLRLGDWDASIIFFMIIPS